MAPHKHTKITTAALRRRETAERRAQDVGPESSGEVARLSARVDELLRELALAQLTIEALRRRVPHEEI